MIRTAPFFPLCAAGVLVSAFAQVPATARVERDRPAAIDGPVATAWDIGPVIRGRNYSVNMPAHPRAVRGGWSFDFPVGSAQAGHVHYITFRPGSLAGYRRITVRYRIDAAPGTRFFPQETPDQPGTVSLYFQRNGDDWRARRGSEYYRWFAPASSVRPLAAGVHEMTIALDDPAWISVWGEAAARQPQAYAEALDDVANIGLLFGSSAARGHGVYAGAPARLTLLAFRIE